MAECLHLLYVGMYEAARRAVAMRDYGALSSFEDACGRQDYAVCRVSLLGIEDALLDRPPRAMKHLARDLGEPCCATHAVAEIIGTAEDATPIAVESGGELAAASSTC
jgi:hypothetical protein